MGSALTRPPVEPLREKHIAASEGQVSVVEALLAEGANVNAADRWGGMRTLRLLRIRLLPCLSLILCSRPCVDRHATGRRGAPGR